MSILSGVAAWWASFAAPDDGKLRNASNVLVALRALADRTVWLKEHLTPDVSAIVVPGLLLNANAPSWTALPDAGTTVHTGSTVGQVVLVDVGLHFSVPFDSAGRDYTIRVVAVDDDGGSGEASTTLFQRTFEADGVALYSVYLGLHLAHTVAVAGTTRIRIEGQRESGATGAITLSSDRNTQRSQRFG